MALKRVFLDTKLKPTTSTEFRAIREERLERERREELKRIQRENSAGKIHSGTMSGNWMKAVYGK